MADITSTQNAKVKLVRALQTQIKARRHERMFVVEGFRLLVDALDNDLLPEYVFYMVNETTMAGSSSRLFRRLLDLQVDLLSVTREVMDAVTAVETSPGILGVFKQPTLPVPAKPRLVLILDEMRNPGNMGSVLRTAAASSVDLVILTHNAVDPYNPKVMRGGMGAHFRLPIVHLSWDEITAQYGGLDVYLADSQAVHAYHDVDWGKPSALIMGSEAHGVSAEARRFARKMVTVPMARGMESLNVAVAAGVILFEAQRQYLAASSGPDDSAQKGPAST